MKPQRFSRKSLARDCDIFDCNRSATYKATWIDLVGHAVVAFYCGRCADTLQRCSDTYLSPL